MVKKEICYYGPQDLLNDYKNFGIHRHAFVPEIFSPRYLKIAQKLGSDLTPANEKRDILNSTDYFKLMAVPPGAYQRRRTTVLGFDKHSETNKFYLVYPKLLNAKEIREFKEFDDEDDEEPVLEVEAPVVVAPA